MLNIKKLPVSYSEISQPNPLRWTILYREDDGTFTNQTNQIKCRDFFNDIVAYKMAGKKFGIYGFNNELKFNDGGLYILLDNIASKARFEANLGVISEQVVEDLNATPHLVEQGGLADSQAIVYIPEIFWTKTFYISMLTLLIRASNYDMQFEGWDDIFKDTSPLRTVDGAIKSSKEAQWMCENGFVLPDEVKSYWHYASKECADQTRSTSMIHNNGVVGWLYVIMNKV